MANDRAPKPEGVISKAIREGLALRQQMLADGTPAAEVDRVVGQALKGAWECSTQQVSDADIRGFYRCGKCFDTGWINTEPSYMERQRLVRLYGDNPQYQGYLAKCDPCPWLDEERRKRRQLQGEADEGLVAAGQTKRKSSLTRFGR